MLVVIFLFQTPRLVHLGQVMRWVTRSISSRMPALLRRVWMPTFF